jgi:hypothetical protein
MTAHLWPGASLGLTVLPLQAMHSDMDIVTRILGLPRRVDITTVARDDDGAAIEVTLRFDGAIIRESVSSLMPISWGARGGYTATVRTRRLVALPPGGWWLAHAPARRLSPTRPCLTSFPAGLARLAITRPCGTHRGSSTTGRAGSAGSCRASLPTALGARAR